MERRTGSTGSVPLQPASAGNTSLDWCHRDLRPSNVSGNQVACVFLHHVHTSTTYNVCNVGNIGNDSNACDLAPHSARIIDFHQPTGAAGTHPRLFDWVKQYFSQASGGSRPQTPLTQTSLPPLYLQHQGACQFLPLVFHDVPAWV